MNILVSACLLGVPCRYDGQSKGCEDVLSLLSDHTLIPICPEQLGGLPTPRNPVELNTCGAFCKNGTNCTKQFDLGALETLNLAKLYHCSYAILKENSPSCGCGTIYDGNFTRTLIPGDGITAALLKKNGIKVYGESQLEELLLSVSPI